MFFFLVTKDISGSNLFSGFVLSTYPKSCGIPSLSINLPTVVLIILDPFSSLNLTFIGDCNVTSFVWYARNASSLSLKYFPAPTASSYSSVK